MKKILFVLLAGLVFVACKKDPKDPAPTPTPAPTTGSIKFEFEPVVGTQSLTLNTVNYVNANKDTFNVSIFRYYISNVKLVKEDNSLYTVNNSYYKIDHNTAGKNLITIGNVPIANYKAVQFLLGVDSTKNVSGAQEGDLAPSDMFWSWSTGYIMAKLEGTSPQSTATGNNLRYHIGGFQGANKVLKNIDLPFGTTTANVSASNTPEVHLKTDILKWFEGSDTIKIANLSVVHMPGANALKIANNYKNMFTFDHIH